MSCRQKIGGEVAVTGIGANPAAQAVIHALRHDDMRAPAGRLWNTAIAAAMPEAEKQARRPRPRAR